MIKYSLVLAISLVSMLYGQGSVDAVTGLMYTDGSPVRVILKGELIEKVERTESVPGSSQLYIAPGLIDIQINGYMGVDFTGPELDIEGIRKVTKALWKEGVTTFLPTLITNSDERLKKNFAILAEALSNPEINNSIPGFHLEGPYISPVKGFRGAHLEKYIRLPDWVEFSEYQDITNNGIKLVTVAPEMEGAIQFIESATEQGIVVALGHHNGTAENILQAVDAGAILSTHLGNGCANMINRHHNPIWPQLSEDKLSISIIVDGFHLTREEVRSFYKAKGLDRTILVSDVLDLAGLKPGTYTRGEREVLLTSNVIKFPAEDVLAGAASPITACVSNMMKFTGCSLSDAITMASTNPAMLMKLDNIGEIKSGKRADLILFTIEAEKIVIHRTIIAGKEVYRKN